ncbi:hypothetical protein [Roseateles sp.]|uniref:hypothetical protein n=1 Tax=Roseateles sp. TaxID=1971397 RepID=UPI0032678DF5
MGRLSTRLVHVATAAFFGLVLFAVLYAGPARRCEAGGGKWNLTAQACITPSCYRSGSCGQWAYPAAWCSKVKPGDDRASVHFHLGDPDQVGVDEAIWHADKGSSDLIVAKFRGDALQSLSCPVAP